MSVDIASKASEYKTELIGGVIVLALLGGLAYYFYNQGKKTTTIATLPYDNGSKNVTTSPDELSQLANSIHSDLKGFAFLSDHNLQPYEDALSLSDTDFTALYNTYNTLFQEQDSYTMAGYINYQSTFGSYEWGTMKETILTRLGKLNLP